MLFRSVRVVFPISPCIRSNLNHMLLLALLVHKMRLVSNLSTSTPLRKDGRRRKTESSQESVSLQRTRSQRTRIIALANRSRSQVIQLPLLAVDVISAISTHSRPIGEGESEGKTVALSDGRTECASSVDWSSRDREERKVGKETVSGMSPSNSSYEGRAMDAKAPRCRGRQRQFVCGSGMMMSRVLELNLRAPLGLGLGLGLGSETREGKGNPQVLRGGGRVGGGSCDGNDRFVLARAPETHQAAAKSASRNGFEADSK